MKRYINNLAELNEAIEVLERKADLQKQELKDHFSGVMDNLKPINLIKHGLQSTFSGENKQDLLKAAIGLGSGILGRKLLMGRFGGNILRKLIGAALEFGVVGIVSKNAQKIKEKGSELIEFFFHKKKSIHTGPSNSEEHQQVNYFPKN
jgi:hypothetical protein